MDEPGDEGQGEGEARDAPRRGRLPGRLARRRRARDRPRRRARERAASRALRLQEGAREARQAGRSRRVGDVAADGQRGEPPGAQRAELPGRDPLVAVLRPRGDPCGEVRGDRRDHRARDQPQLRRSGRALRRRGEALELVDPGGLRALRGVRCGAREAVRCVPSVPRRGGQRQADARREHRRPRGAGCGVRRVERQPQGRGRAGRGRPERRPAVLRQLLPELAGEDARARAPSGDVSPPTATRRRSTARRPSGTSTRGIRRSGSARKTHSISIPSIESASGDASFASCGRRSRRRATSFTKS